MKYCGKYKPKYKFKYKKKKNLGQALVEYLFLFAFMTLITLGFVRIFSGYVGMSIGGVAYYLTEYLSTGHCKSNCLANPYKNLDE